MNSTRKTTRTLLGLLELPSWDARLRAMKEPHTSSRTGECRAEMAGSLRRRPAPRRPAGAAPPGHELQCKGLGKAVNDIDRANGAPPGEGAGRSGCSELGGCAGRSGDKVT